MSALVHDSILLGFMVPRSGKLTGNGQATKVAKRRTGAWWARMLLGEYLVSVSLEILKDT